MIEDAKFYAFSDSEFKAWIYILSQASQQASGVVTIFPEHADRVCKISSKSLFSAIDKLERYSIVKSICTDHERVTNVSRTCDERDPNATNKQTNKQNTFVNTNAGFALDEVFLEYPKRKGDHGKKTAMQRLAKSIKTPEDFSKLKQAAKNYRAHCDSEKITGTPFVKRFSTWVGVWEEWATSEQVRNSTSSVGKPLTDEDMEKLLRGGT